MKMKMKKFSIFILTIFIMILKTSKLDENTKTEILKSEKIKTIENYQYRYAPIEKIKTARLSNAKSIVTCYTRNIGKKTLEEYIKENMESKRIIEIINSLEEYLRESIKKMNSLGIYHLNIGQSSIIIDEINDIPIITYNKSQPESIVYPIEYYIINYPQHEIMTKEISEEIFDNFIGKSSREDGLKEIFDKYKTAPMGQKISDNELIEMKERYNKYITKYMGKRMDTIKKSIEKKTWDHYLLSVVFYSILTDIENMPKLNEIIEKHKKIILTNPYERII